MDAYFCKSAFEGALSIYGKQISLIVIKVANLLQRNLQNV
jgi:hypothetical protein